VTTSSKSARSAAIRTLIDKRVEALCVKDADGVVADRRPKVVSSPGPAVGRTGDRQGPRKD